jgi:hypothetical protein
VQLVQPADGAVFVVAPELGRTGLIFRATAPGATRISFAVNGEPAGGGEGADAAVAWRLVPGLHVLEARAHFPDGSVRSQTSSFEVRQP